MSVLHLTSENFETEVLKSDKPVLVDFWASWCGPCKMLGPVVEEIGNEIEDVKVCKVNVDEQESIASKYKIMSIPTLLLFKNGKVENTSVGFIPKAQILEFIKG